MAECIPIAMQLLGSKVVSDVLESLEFLATAFEFQVGGSREGVRKALLLVWSREQQVREAVVNAYVRLYLNPSVSWCLLAYVQLHLHPSIFHSVLRCRILA